MARRSTVPVVRFEDDASASKLKQRLLSKVAPQPPKISRVSSDRSASVGNASDGNVAAGGVTVNSVSVSSFSSSSQEREVGSPQRRMNYPRRRDHIHGHASKRMRLFKLPKGSGVGDESDIDALLAGAAAEQFGLEATVRHDSDHSMEDQGEASMAKNEEDRGDAVQVHESDSDSGREQLLRAARSSRSYRSKPTKVRKKAIGSMRHRCSNDSGSGSEQSGSGDLDDGDGADFQFARVRTTKTGTMSQILGGMSSGSKRKHGFSKSSKGSKEKSINSSKTVSSLALARDKKKQRMATIVNEESEEEIEEVEELAVCVSSSQSRKLENSQSELGDDENDEDDQDDETQGGKGSTTDIMLQLLGSSSSSRQPALNTVESLLTPSRREKVFGNRSTKTKKFGSNKSSGFGLLNNPVSQCAHQLSRARASFVNSLAATAHWQRERQLGNSNNLGSDPWFVPCLKLHISRVFASDKRLSGSPAHVVQANAVVLDLANFALNEVARKSGLRVGMALRLIFPRALVGTGDSSGRHSSFDSPVKGIKQWRGSSQNKSQEGFATMRTVERHKCELGHLQYRDGAANEVPPVDNLAGCEVSVWWPFAFSKLTGIVVTQSVIAVDRVNVSAPLWANSEMAAGQHSHQQQQSHSYSDDEAALLQQEQKEHLHEQQKHHHHHHHHHHQCSDDDDELVADLDLGDGWSALKPGALDILGQKTVSHFSAAIECAVMRDALKFATPGVSLLTDCTPPGSVWSSVLLSRPMSPDNKDAKNQYCELLVPPQYVAAMMDVLQDDGQRVFTITNARQVGVRPFQSAAKILQEDSKDSDAPRATRMPSLRCNRSLRWDVVLAQRPRQEPRAMFDMPVLQCDHNTRALLAPPSVQITQQAPHVRIVAGTEAETNGDGSPKIVRTSILCRLIHLHDNVLFVLDAACAPDHALKPLLVFDPKLRAAVLAQCPKGAWILCRDALVANDETILDEASIVEKVDLRRDLGDGGLREQLLVSLPIVSNSSPSDCVGSIVSLPWVRLAASFPEDHDNIEDDQAVDSNNTQDSIVRAETARKEALRAVVNGQPDGALEVPMLARAIEVPDDFNIAMQGRIETLSSKLTRMIGNSGVPVTDMVTSGGDAGDWSLLNVDGCVTHFGFAHKLTDADTNRDAPGPNTTLARSWRFSKANESIVLTVGKAIELVRPPDALCDVALELQVNNYQRHVLVRTRYHDLLKLVGHATPDELLLEALKELSQGVKLPCLMHRSHLKTMSDARTNTNSSGNETPIFLTSLALLDEQHCEILT